MTAVRPPGDTRPAPPGPRWRTAPTGRLAVALAGILGALLAGLLTASASTAVAATRLSAHNGVGVTASPATALIGPTHVVLPGQRRARAPDYDQKASGSSVAAETGASAASAGDHILLGLQSSGIEDFAPQIGARTLMQSADFRTELVEGLQSPDTRFSLQLQGLSGATPEEQIANAIARNAEYGFPHGGITNWEISMLQQFGRLGDTTFYEGKTIVSNPWASGG